MSSSEHKPNEKQAFSIACNALKDRYGDVQLIPEQKDKPDFGFIWKNKRIGVEVVALDDSELLRAISSHEAQKLTKARKKELHAIKNLQPYTRYNQTIKPDTSFVKPALDSKLKLYETYKSNFDEVFLLLHCESFENINFLNLLKVIANNYLLDNDCLFSKVYLVDLKNNRFIGKVFDFKNKKRLKIPKKLLSYESETRISHFFPVAKEFNIYETYESEVK